eukprot:1328278-Amorphochlora_amoeboformis.AAC.1
MKPQRNKTSPKHLEKRWPISDMSTIKKREGYMQNKIPKGRGLPTVGEAVGIELETTKDQHNGTVVGAGARELRVGGGNAGEGEGRDNVGGERIEKEILMRIQVLQRRCLALEEVMGKK